MTLIRFDADRGDFRDSPGGPLQVLADFTRAVVTGTPGQGAEMGEVKPGDVKSGENPLLNRRTER